MRDESVKVCDRELEKLAELAACWDDINTVLGKFISVLKTVHLEAVKDGDIHVALENLYYFTERFHKNATNLGSKASGAANKLVSKIEDIDLNIYNG